MNYACSQCRYDKLPDEQRPKACVVIHKKKLNMPCDYFEKVR